MSNNSHFRMAFACCEYHFIIFLNLFGKNSLGFCFCDVIQIRSYKSHHQKSQEQKQFNWNDYDISLPPYTMHTIYNYFIADLSKYLNVFFFFLVNFINFFSLKPFAIRFSKITLNRFGSPYSPIHHH